MESQFNPQPPSDSDLSLPGSDELAAGVPPVPPEAPQPTAVPPTTSPAAPRPSMNPPIPPQPSVAPTAAPGGRPPLPPPRRAPPPPGGRPPVYPGPGVPYPGPAPRPAPVPRPAPTPAPKPAEKKGPGIGTRIILRCIALLLSLLLFVTLLAGVLIYDGKELLKAENLHTLLNELESDDYEDNDLLLMIQDEMVYWVNELFVHEYGSYYELERDDIVDFLEESTINEFLAEKAAGYVRDIMEDTRKTKVTSRDLRKLYKENKDIMEDELGIQISSEIDAQILQNLDRIDVDAMIEENVFDYLDSEDGPGEDFREILELVSTVFSDDGFLVCIVIAVILMIALILSNRLRPAGSLVHIGLPMVLAGGIMVIPVFLAGPLFQTVFSAIGGEMTRDAEYALTLLLSKCGPILTNAPLTLLIIGGVFLLAAPFMKLIFKKK